MPEKKRLVGNAVLMTASAILMDIVAMAYRSWLVGSIGSGGVGLFQLTMSVAALAATVAVSGVRFASTRLVSETLGLGKTREVRCVMDAALRYALFFGTLAALLLYTLSDGIAAGWIADARTARSLRVCAVGLPFIAVSAALSGYFIASGRVWKSTVIHIAEQLLGVALSVMLLNGMAGADAGRSCAAICVGRTTADAVSALLLWWAYRKETENAVCPPQREITPRLLSIALPLAVSAYARSALSTAQQLFVPRGLKLSGYSAQAALAGYGIMQGMALPALLFPACLTRAVAELIVPELTRAQMQNRPTQLRQTAERFIYRNAIYALVVSLLMFLFADGISLRVYHTRDAARCIRLLAPLIPVMYTDTAVDGCLKGLGEQVWCMAVNILDALIGLVMTVTLLPRYALGGYLVMIYVSECVNLLLSAARLIRRLRKIEQPPMRSGAVNVTLFT